jgi:hypothetical protein
MMIVIPKGYDKARPGAMPDAKLVAEMAKYNESLHKAGVMLSGEGLHPPSMGARVSFSGGKPKVTDGPFAEAKDLVGGYTIVEATDIAEAAEISKGCPIFERSGFVEVRPVMKM